MLKLIKQCLFPGVSKRRGTGRGSDGSIIIRRRGGGLCFKRVLINYVNVLNGLVGRIISFFFSNNRSKYYALVYYSKLGIFSYIVASSGLKIGSLITSFIFFNFENSNKSILYRLNKFSSSSFYVNLLPLGIKVYNVVLLNSNKRNKNKFLFSSAPGVCSKIVRNFFLINKNNKKEKCIGILLPSGKVKYVSGFVLCTVGVVSNTIHRFFCWDKAGYSRKMGYRPSVRGVAMNPVDHPHGGKTSGGRPSVSPWGWVTKRFHEKVQV